MGPDEADAEVPRARLRSEDVQRLDRVRRDVVVGVPVRCGGAALVQVVARDAAAIDVIAAARPPLRAPKVL